MLARPTSPIIIGLIIVQSILENAIAKHARSAKVTRPSEWHRLFDVVELYF